MSSKSSRREFLKQVTLAGVGAACSSLIPEAAQAASQGPKSRIVIARNTSALTGSASSGWSVRKDVIESMLGSAVAKLTGKANAAAAWKSMFRPDDIVGIKVNCLCGIGASTHPEVAHAVADALVRAGVKPENIIIWDRATGDLLKSGYKINTSGPGVRVLANDGVWEDKPTRLGAFDGRLTKILTEQITALVNVPVMKDHGGAGITGAMKNHYGSFDNPGRHHGNNCDPYIADLNAIPAIRNKTRLVVMDALTPIANGGPGLNRASQWSWYGLILGKDPVAVDWTQWQVIEERRKQTGLPTLTDAGRRPKWIAHAAELGLGTDDPANMEVIHLG